MAFDLTELSQAVEAHGRVARVVIAEVRGSSPREVGASMLVWPDGQSGTIGGGALEYQAARHAFARTGLSRHPLGPELGQCCGGAVTLLTEHYTADTLPHPVGAVVARGPGDMPLAVHRVLDAARAQGSRPQPALTQGWMIEPVAQPTSPVWIWGAGHVGRALVATLDGLPDLALTWVDTARNRFPDIVPEHITCLPAAQPERLMPHAPRDAAHLILTYSHELDLRLCDAALRHHFGFAGVIGSRTKATRFRNKLRKLGHMDAEIDRICCPIGQKSLGKHPQAIAIGVAAQLLSLEKGNHAAWPTFCSA